MNVQSRFESNGLGPFQNYLQVCCGSLDTAAQTFEPVLKGAARCQLELLGLMSRRAQAQLDFASRVTRCRDPQELFSESVRFWQTASQHYADGSRRIMAAWAQMATAPMAAFACRGERPERDYITFAADHEPRDEPPRNMRERRAA